MAKAKKLFDEKNLTKGQLRKLTAIRRGMSKLLGAQVGTQQADKGFAEWLASNQTAATNPGDADLIAQTLWKMVAAKKLRIPKGGFAVRRGHKRVIVTPLEG